MTAGTRPLVAVSTYGAAGASTRVRIYDWLVATGASAEVHDYAGTSDNQVQTLLRSAPAVWRAERGLRALVDRLGDRNLIMSRQASPFSSGRLESELLEAAGRSAYDFDDALFNDTGSWTRQIWSKKSLWTRSVQSADVVIAGSDFLADEASKFSANVVMIPSCIEPERYRQKSNFELGEIPRAVWIGSRSTEQFLLPITESLLRLNREFGLRLTVISGGKASLGALDLIVDRRQWTPQGFAQELSQGDIGIMPLPDTPFTRGKCAYKILQYAGARLPIVASPVGSNEQVIRRFGAYAAASTDEWYGAVAGILEMTAQQRSSMGATAHSAVVEGYSFDAWKHDWLEAVGLAFPIE